MKTKSLTSGCGQLQEITRSKDERRSKSGGGSSGKHVRGPGGECAGARGSNDDGSRKRAEPRDGMGAGFSALGRAWASGLALTLAPGWPAGPAGGAALLADKRTDRRASDQPQAVNVAAGKGGRWQWDSETPFHFVSCYRHSYGAKSQLWMVSCPYSEKEAE